MFGGVATEALIAGVELGTATVGCAMFIRDTTHDGPEVGVAMAEVIAVNLCTKSSLGILQHRERVVGEGANEVGDASLELVDFVEVLQEAATTVLEGTGTFARLVSHGGEGSRIGVVASRARCRLMLAL